MEDPVVRLERNLGMLNCQPSKTTIHICVCGRTKMGGKTKNIEPTWKILMEDVDLGEPTSLLDHVNLDCTHRRECQISKDIVANYRDDVRIQDFCWSQGKTTDQSFRGP